MPQIRVRLVPKSSLGLSIPDEPDLAARTEMVERSPGPNQARAALASAAKLLRVEPTPKHRIEGTVDSAEFKALFKANLKEVAAPKSDRGMMATAAETTLQPTAELTVPDELKDTIAFAYVPTPPEYFAISAIPPQASIYHLRLEDVARQLGAYRCHRQGWTGRGVRLAMADSGFAAHPFFTDYGFNIQRISTPSTSHPETDESGHGTGESGNALVIAPDCTFFGIKHDDYSALALETSLAQNPKIITNSWGWNIDNMSMDQFKIAQPNQYNELRDVANIVANAIASDVIVIFSGGNGHRPFPACIPDVIAAGGTTVDASGGLSASSYASSYVSKLYPDRRIPDFCGIVGESGTAPLRGHIMLPVPNGAELEGDNMIAAQKNKGWGIFSGTSAAAPQIAGVVALMLSVNPLLKPGEVKSILAATCRDVTAGKSAHGDAAGPGWDAATGSGLIDAFAACVRVQQGMV